MPELPDNATLGEGIAFFHWVTKAKPQCLAAFQKHLQNHRGLLFIWRYYPETFR